MCGILGIFGYTDVSREIAFGLTCLQHRGQDAAGVVTFNKHFRIKKGNGLVNQVFDDKILSQLEAPCGLGHVRYATQGLNDIQEAQPIYMNYPFGLAMVHNGNVVNFSHLAKTLREQNRVIETTNDLELILCTLASNLEGKNLKNFSVDDLFDAVESTQKMVSGAYAAIALLAGQGMLAFCDPHGIRPLVLGKKISERGTVYSFSSETCALESLGFEVVRELQAGEAVFIDNQRNLHSKILHHKAPAFCVFEYIYFARDDSVINNTLVAKERVRMGKALAKSFEKFAIHPDVVIDVPSSAYFSASGLAEELQVPYRRGLAKNPYIGRSFLFPTQSQRDMAVRQKLSPIKPIIAGKKVAVIDDSIVRGTTSRRIVNLLRETGAEKVYFVSAAPPVKFPCVYGIDMSVKTELIAGNNSIEDISKYLGADAIIYQSLEDLQEIFKDRGLCTACFSGCYPTGISSELLYEIECERMHSKASAILG
ncbi:MAG: amidophosphoribosyltransferase [Candidatus Riflebacteria bacterium]|nr:amidophosphoribosyltransferase [Candidatus Riflebacteria bacterium]